MKTQGQQQPCDCKARQKARRRMLAGEGNADLFNGLVEIPGTPGCYTRPRARVDY